MKKAIVLILIAIVAVSSAFAFKFVSVGIETGNGYHISGDMEIADKFDVYARLGYYGAFAISGGAQYKIGEFKIGSTPVAIKPGAQMTFGFPEKSFIFDLLVTCQFSFETGHLTAFVRPGLGLSVYSYKYHSYYEDKDIRETNTSFDWTIECGVAYLF